MTLLSGRALGRSQILKKGRKNDESKQKKLPESFQKECPPRYYRVSRAQCGKELLKEIPPAGNDLLCLDGHKKK
jgi:hypothetical protein